MPGKQTLTREQHRIRFTLGQTVLDTVGTPLGFVRTEITLVGPTQWRINLLVDTGRGCHRRAHCYYAYLTPDGTIRSFNPPLEPLYAKPRRTGTEIKPDIMSEPAVS
jgi:hypothetical protein